MALLAGTAVVHHLLLGDVTRLDGSFAGLEPRPAEAAEGALDILLLGVRHAGPATRGGSGEPLPWVRGATLESVMIVHLAADRRSGAVAAIPLSRSVAGALAGAQPSVVVGAVETMTGVRMDHLVVVDWATVESLAADNGSPALGADAASATAQARHQLVFLQHVAEDTLHAELRRDPWRLYRVVETATDGLAVDDEWSGLELARLAFSLRDLRSADLGFFVAEPAARNAWAAVRRDRVGRWAAEHPYRIEEAAS